jgi:hypothetical protein
MSRTPAGGREQFSVCFRAGLPLGVRTNSTMFAWESVSNRNFVLVVLVMLEWSWIESNCVSSWPIRSFQSSGFWLVLGVESGVAGTASIEIEIATDSESSPTVFFLLLRDHRQDAVLRLGFCVLGSRLAGALFRAANPALAWPVSGRLETSN